MADKDEKDTKEDKPEQAVIAYHYVPGPEHAGMAYPGVPPGDILQDKYDELPKWVQKSIAESPMYKKVEPKKAAAPRKKAAPKKAAAPKSKAAPKQAPSGPVTQPAPMYVSDDPEPEIIVLPRPTEDKESEK